MSRVMLLWLSCGATVGTASAQVFRLEGQATFAWQASTDNGVTWQGSLVSVNPSQSFLVRASVAFEPGAGRYFSGSWYDPYVTNAGPGDAADSFAMQFPFSVTDSIASFHQGTTMRIERGNDGAPPGQGVGWIKSEQSAAIGPVTFANPVVALTFRFLPDSTPGDRVLTSAFFVTPGWDASRFVRVNLFADPDATQFVPATTLLPLTIRVIPAPSALGVLVAGFIVAARRRR